MNKTITVLFEKVVPDKENPRQEFDPAELRKLETSIKANGILNPLMVEEQEDGRYLLIDGERRYRASKNLKLKELPVIVLPPMSEVERMIKRFNLQEQHSQWNLWEKARALQKFHKDTGMKPGEVADALGITRQQVESYSLIATLSNRTTKLFTDRKLPYNYVVEMGRLIKNVEQEDLRSDIADAIIARVDDKIILRSSDIRKYSRAVMQGGEKIVRAMLKDKRYTPTQAGRDAGTDVWEMKSWVYNGANNVELYGLKLLLKKHVTFTGSQHRKFLATKKVLDQLVGLDWEEVKKGRKPDGANS